MQLSQKSDVYAPTGTIGFSWNRIENRSWLSAPSKLASQPASGTPSITEGNNQRSKVQRNDKRLFRPTHTQQHTTSDTEKVLRTIHNPHTNKQRANHRLNNELKNNGMGSSWWWKMEGSITRFCSNMWNRHWCKLWVLYCKIVVQCSDCYWSNFASVRALPDSFR